MRTDSIRFPSDKRKRNFRVVSSEPRTRTVSMPPKGERLGQMLAEILGKIGHFLERSDALLVDPIRDLLRAVGTLVLGGQISRDLFQKKGLNRWFAGGLHFLGYPTPESHSKRRSDLAQRARRSQRIVKIGPAFSLCVPLWTPCEVSDSASKLSLLARTHAAACGNGDRFDQDKSHFARDWLGSGQGERRSRPSFFKARCWRSWLRIT